MTSKNNSVSASTTMSSLGKACLELSKSIKGFRFSRQSPQDSKDAVSSSGAQQQQSAGAAAAQTTVTTTVRPMTTEDGSLSAPLTDDVTSGVSDGATGGGSSVTSTISRVIRSATNRVRAFPSSPGPSAHHHHQQQQQQQACNAVNGHNLPAHVPLPPPPPTMSTPPPPHTSTTTIRARYIQPAGSTDIWHDERFLLGFFRYFSAMELCVLAQVRHNLLPPSHTFFHTISVSLILCDFHLLAYTMEVLAEGDLRNVYNILFGNT